MARCPVRILIADDHEMVRRGLVSFLEAFPDLEIVGEAENGEEALKLCSAGRPDVVITDLNMPVMDGVEVTRRIMQEYPGIKVIVVTGSLDESKQQEAIRAGAVRCVQKDNGYHELPDIVLAACTPPAL
jgi:NarL family two-component system response regulator LiaR